MSFGRTAPLPLTFAIPFIGSVSAATVDPAPVRIVCSPKFPNSIFLVGCFLA